jgi:hypothetical protein
MSCPDEAGSNSLLIIALLVVGLVEIAVAGLMSPHART